MMLMIMMGKQGCIISNITGGQNESSLQWLSHDNDNNDDDENDENKQINNEGRAVLYLLWMKISKLSF